MSLAGKDDRTVIALDDQGLMALDMPWCRYHVHAWRDLGLTVKQLIPGTGEVDEPFHRVVTRTCSLELATLTQNRATRELVVSADVVKVQVTVHYRLDVAQDVAVGLQRRGKRRPARPVPCFDFLPALTHPRVENDQFVVVGTVRCGGDGLSVHRLDPGFARPGLLRWPHEGTQVQPPHLVNPHSYTLRTDDGAVPWVPPTAEASTRSAGIGRSAPTAAIPDGSSAEWPAAVEPLSN